ncbi:hypothetical protein M0D69_41145, partial [Caballeronia sp. SEWSISQ10-4 2]|nr:hypothetical protein [Caballeronia sp. SEWSISQ10-4 2]
MRFTGPGTADGFGSRSVDASTGTYKPLRDLKFAAMIQGEAREGDWSVFADTVLLSFGKHGASVIDVLLVLKDRDSFCKTATSGRSM